MLNQTEMRKHPGSPRSIVAYLSEQKLTVEDRELIAEISQPEGWNDNYVNYEDLTADELEARAHVLDKIKKYPAIKVRFKKLFQLSQLKLRNHIMFVQEPFFHR